jgi:hypothetical protein
VHETRDTISCLNVGCSPSVSPRPKAVFNLVKSIGGPTHYAVKPWIAIAVGIFIWFAAQGPSYCEEIPEHYTPVRAVGMGGAFTAIANDEGSVFTNPAGISRVRKARSRSTVHIFRFPNLVGGANAESRTFYKGFQGAQDKNIEEIIEQTEDLGNKPFWVRAAALPIMLLDIQRGTPIAIGGFTNTKVKAIIERESPEEARIQAVSDVGGILSLALTNRTNRFSVGMTVRPTFRYAYEERFPSEDLLNKTTMKTRFENGANVSQGIGIDLGTIYTVGDFWFPTIGMSVLNLPTGCKKEYLNPFTEKRETVCGNVYSGQFSNEDALSTVDPMDIRVGASITPRISRKIGLRLALDVHHLAVTGTTNYGLDGIEASKLIHAGAELFTGNPLLISPFSLRVGYNQGFLTMGATVDLSFMSLEFATYGQDVSSGVSPVEDRRYLGKFTFDF